MRQGPSIGPEFELLVACCRRSGGSDGGDDFRRLSNEVDWAKFLRLMQRHRVQGLAERALEKDAISPPVQIANEIIAEARSVGIANLRFAAESMRLVHAFEDASIALLFVKGLTLSALVYGDPFVKMSSDIDILVGHDAVERAANILEKLGYRLSTPALRSFSGLSKWHARYKESVWHNSENGLLVELHTRLADNPVLIPRIGMASPRQLVGIGGHGALPTLTSDDLFAYLTVHGASSAWFRLKWISDFAALVHEIGEDATDCLYRCARTQGAGRAPAQALLLADSLSLLVLPSALRRELQRDPVNRLLARIGRRELANEKEPTERPLGTAAIHLSQPLLLNGFRFKLSELKRQTSHIGRRLGFATESPRQ